MLDGVLDDFVGKVNQHLAPLKERIASVDTLSMLYLIIGLLATAVLSAIVGILFSYVYTIVILILYLASLWYVFWRNSRITSQL